MHFFTFYLFFFVYRLHYYLQLKNDILEEKIHCNSRQACLLVGYSMQAEFGDYSQDKHTINYFKQCVFFANVTLILIFDLAQLESSIHDLYSVLRM